MTDYIHDPRTPYFSRLVKEAMMKPTDQNRLGDLMGKVEAATTDGDVRDLTQDDIGDIYSWLMWAMDQQGVCECGQPKNSIRHSFSTARSVDAHEFKPASKGTKE